MRKEEGDIETTKTMPLISLINIDRIK